MTGSVGVTPVLAVLQLIPKIMIEIIEVESKDYSGLYAAFLDIFMVNKLITAVMRKFICLGILLFTHPSPPNQCLTRCMR